MKDQFSSVAQSCPTLCDPMNCSTPGLLVHHQVPEFTQTHVHWVSDAIQPSHLCRPLLLLPLIFSSIRVFSNESALRISWPKDWSFSFNISPTNEHPGLISFRMNWLDLLADQGILKSLLQHQFKSINSLALSFLYYLPVEEKIYTVLVTLSGFSQEMKLFLCIPWGQIKCTDMSLILTQPLLK